MDKGDIWLVEIPQTNGHEQSGKRPVIIITESNIAIIIPFTSNIQVLRFPHTIEVEPSKSNGLTMKSVALVFQIRAIDKKRLKSKIGGLESIIIMKINKMLKNLLKIQNDRNLQPDKAGA